MALPSRSHPPGTSLPGSPLATPGPPPRERRLRFAAPRRAYPRPRDPEPPWRRCRAVAAPGLRRAPAFSAPRAAAWSPSWCGRCGRGWRPRRWVGLVARPGGKQGGPVPGPGRGDSPPGSVPNPGKRREPRALGPRTHGGDVPALGVLLAGPLITAGKTRQPFFPDHLLPRYLPHVKFC